MKSDLTRLLALLQRLEDGEDTGGQMKHEIEEILKVVKWQMRLRLLMQGFVVLLVLGGLLSIVITTIIDAK